MEKLLTQRQASRVAKALIEADVFELAPRGSHFLFRSGLQAPCKLIIERLFEAGNEVQLRIVVRHVHAAVYPWLQKQHNLDPRFLTFAGVPSGGTQWANLLACRCEAHCCTVKKLGSSREPIFIPQVEENAGKVHIGVEDVLTQGGSSAKLVVALRNARAIARTFVALASYEFPVSAERFDLLGVDCAYLVSFTDVRTALRQSRRYSPAVLDELRLWQFHYQAWLTNYPC
jgi:orotate phosphoribosyltransferase